MQVGWMLITPACIALFVCGPLFPFSSCYDLVLRGAVDVNCFAIGVKTRHFGRFPDIR